MPVISSETKRSGETRGTKRPLGIVFVCVMTNCLLTSVKARGSAFSSAGIQKEPSAEKFVHKLYAAYATDPDYSSLGPNEPQIYSTGIMRLINADKKRTPADYESAIDADPLCACQDEDGLRLLDVRVTPAPKERVDALVTLRLFKDSPNLTRLRLQLVHEHTGWRVDDVIAPTGASLKQILTSAPQ